MSVGWWIVIIFLGLFLLPTMVISFIIYHTLLVRNKKEKWARSASMPEDEEYVRLYQQAAAWGKQYAACKRDVAIENDGLHLAGEYFDFGGENAVIIIPGRMESCRYSYHYSEPYRKAGWNILAIDTRAHGDSDGKINSLGYKEYRDILAWARLLHEELGNKLVVLHGICIGSSTALFAATAADCPDYVAGLTVDGMYTRFYDSCKQHMILDHRPLFPFLWETMLYIRLVSGADVIWDGPYKRIRKLKKPILFIHSREDQFSLPAKAQTMFDQCPARQKTLAWFPHGGHSRVRINNPELYDQTVCKFLASTDFINP